MNDGASLSVQILPEDAGDSTLWVKYIPSESEREMRLEAVEYKDSSFRGWSQNGKPLITEKTRI